MNLSLAWRKLSRRHVLTCFLNNFADGLADVTSQPESVHDEEEEIVEEQKDEGKLGFCEIQWQQKSPFIDGRKFTKKNFKRLDDAKLSLSITKIDEEDQLQIIKLTSPMKVRSPLGYRSCHNLDEKPIENVLSASSKIAPVHTSAASIKTISHPTPETSSHESLRKSSLLSLKSLSMSLRMLKKGGRNDSFDHDEPSTTLETIDETQTRKSIFQMDIFERNLKKFTTKSNEADFQSYSEYQQQQQNPKKSQKTLFKNQKIYDRRSSTSDIHEANPQPKNLHHHSGISTSSSNVKHDKHEKHDRHDKKHHKDEKKSEKDKTVEMLKEVRKRNLETSKRISAPRRISTAY